MKKWFKKYFY